MKGFAVNRWGRVVLNPLDVEMRTLGVKVSLGPIEDQTYSLLIRQPNYWLRFREHPWSDDGGERLYRSGISAILWSQTRNRYVMGHAAEHYAKVYGVPRPNGISGRGGITYGYYPVSISVAYQFGSDPFQECDHEPGLTPKTVRAATSLAWAMADQWKREGFDYDDGGQLLKKLQATEEAQSILTEVEDIFTPLPDKTFML